ncbi:MAG: hypothetical protein E7667_04005 [Ruminococcaceae bacterium]|nr:hypothetical protein [Oscillospiraceae bacterium]
METYVFIDILFLINFSMDYLCLYISARILNRPRRAGRMIAASAIGALYSVISIFLSFSQTISLVSDVFVCFLMCVIAFHSKKQTKNTFVATLLYFAVSMAIGGIMTALFNLLNKINLPLESIDGDGVSVWGFAILAILGGIISILGGNLIFRKKEIGICLLTITFNKNVLTLNALSDSGNLIKDAISGKPVIIIDKAAAKGVVDTSILDDFMQGIHTKDPAYSSMRITPINTVSGRSALVILRADKIEISYQKGKNTLSFSPDAMFALGDIGKSSQGYDAIIPYSLFRGL